MKNQLILGVLLCPFFSFAMETEATSPDVDPCLLDKLRDYTIQQNDQYCKTPHNPLLIMISGCAGMGKTTLAKLLQENLHILRFSGDDTRTFLKEYGDYDQIPAEERFGRILGSFAHFVSRVQTEPNKCIIFDESIDRQKPPAYEKVSEIVKLYQYSTFVVRLKVEKETARRRILERVKNNPSHTEHFKQHFDQYYTFYEEFNSEKVDFSLDNEGFFVEKDCRPLIEAIKDKLAYE